MQKSQGPSVQAIIEQGLVIFSTEGTARAWVFMTFHSIPTSIVTEVLATAARQRTTTELKRAAVKESNTD